MMNIHSVKQQLIQHFFGAQLNDVTPLSELELSKALFFEELAISDHQEASTFVTPNDRNAMWYFLRAALRGNAEASFRIGLSYLHGQLGLDKNYEKATEWLNKAIAQGHPEAKKYLYAAYGELAFS